MSCVCSTSHQLTASLNLTSQTMLELSFLLTTALMFRSASSVHFAILHQHSTDSDIFRSVLFYQSSVGVFMRHSLLLYSFTPQLVIPQFFCKFSS